MSWDDGRHAKVKPIPPPGSTGGTSGGRAAPPGGTDSGETAPPGGLSGGTAVPPGGSSGSQVIVADGRGKKTVLGTEMFELDYPSENITSVEGYNDKVYGVATKVMTSLSFQTNKTTSPLFDMTAEEISELKDEGNKIVGFHGKAGD